MMKPVLASLTLLSLTAAVAHADDTQTTTATNLVVVTPNAPVIVTTGGAAPASFAPAGPGAALATTPGAAAAAPPAPQTNDWKDVSHINGQVVPVGERGAYLYTFRKTNIAANPFGLLASYLDASVSHAVSENIAISGAISAHSGNGSDDFLIATISAPIYFRRTFSGPFLEPGVQFNAFQRTSYDYYNSSGSYTPTSTQDNFAAVAMTFGWQWMFDSGLNVAVAGGIARRVGNSDPNSYGDDVLPAGYFRVGYAF
jgi:hypothetical protein